MPFLKRKNILKHFLKQLLFKKGYEITRIKSFSIQNKNPFVGVKDKISIQTPIFFDVGANNGQTIKKIRKEFPDAIIHSFEPSKYCFQRLIKEFNSEKLILNNLALGKKEEILTFNEYSWDPLNSLLERTFTKSAIKEKYDVQVTTIDEYCKKNSIPKIDFLKTDTEGFELNVLKGAEELIKNDNIQFIHVEIFFESHFHGQSSAGDIINFLEKNNFSLVRFYDFNLAGNGVASKSDVLFVNLNYKYN